MKGKSWRARMHNLYKGKHASKRSSGKFGKGDPDEAPRADEGLHGLNEPEPVLPLTAEEKRMCHSVFAQAVNDMSQIAKVHDHWFAWVHKFGEWVPIQKGMAPVKDPAYYSHGFLTRCFFCFCSFIK